MSKKNDPEYLAKLDDYELKPHYDFDYRKAKPNRFAGRAKLTHPNAIPRGGARNGAGRKPAREPIERHTITLLKSDAAFLRKLDKRLSIAIRKMIAQERSTKR
ncbi:MAG: hypothetical protein HY741_26605 [Chloroflexi bacterium]|nr:hypothetical protein [Chloroflexota bacterium]